MGDDGKHEQTNTNGNSKGNGILGIGILFVAAAVIVVAVPVLLLKSGDEPTNAPVPVPTTPLPTVTSLFTPNSQEACAAISQGVSVPDQDNMIRKHFDITIDVSLTSDLYDHNKVVEELQSTMQQILAPKLADCPSSRRLRVMDDIQDLASRKLLEEHVIGNVLFDLRLDSTGSCEDGAPSPCIVINTDMILYLKGNQNRLPLMKLVSNIFKESVALKSGPFALITITEQKEVAMTPTLAPTEFSIYDANSAEECESISMGGPVPNQDNMVVKGFDVRFDVSLTLLLSDVSELVEDVEKRLQQYIAPQIAECLGYRRLSQEDEGDGAMRKLVVERNAIGNARFFLTYQPEMSCDAGAPAPCIRLLGKLNLFLKGEEDTLPLANHIINFVGQDLIAALRLSAPFNVVEVVGVAVSAPFVPGPTLAPSMLTIPVISEDCAAIALGLPLPDQAFMTKQSFVAKFNVNLTLELSDVTELVLEIESRMQRILAPMLAECPESLRRLRRTMNLDEAERNLLEGYGVGNALFKLSHRESETCEDTESPCIRVDAMLDLFLTENAGSTLEIIAHIAGVLNGELVTVLELYAPFAEIQLTEISAEPNPTESPTSPPNESPASLPTEPLVYDPNSPEECEAISRGELAPFQDAMINKTFDIRMDVSLTLELSDLAEVVQELESRMQRILGPEFADCSGARRLGEAGSGEDGTVRHLLERHVIANALFDAVYEEDQACDAVAPTPCIHVLVKLTMILKGEEAAFPLVNRITVLLGGSEPLTDVLGLTAPFDTIEVVSVSLQ
mmetsp:Transcript_42232/g.102066  ORF Transcript_42232/g.102066 Transcript_42232/m.102066 type:complete len:790 (+) Transcript_42232:66-2435(+)